jgi:signal transduction histidine kinase
MGQGIDTAYSETVQELRLLYRAAEARAARLRFIIEVRDLLDAEVFETAAKEILSRIVVFAVASRAVLVLPQPQGGQPLQLSAGSPASDTQTEATLFAWENAAHLQLTISAVSREPSIDPDDRQTLEVVAGQLADAFNLERQAAERLDLLGNLERQRNELSALVAQLIEAQEQERRRVAQDLHDGAAQLVAALGYHLQSLGARVGNGHALRAELDELATLARRSVADLRAAIADLRPAELDDLGLAAALRARLDAIDGIEVIADLDPAAEHWPASTGIVFYRVAQEAIINVVKHAGATRLIVRLFEDDEGRAHLEVIDNGKGIVEKQDPSTRGERLGIIGMRERLALLGGEITIGPGPCGGTCICAVAPLTREAVGT